MGESRQTLSTSLLLPRHSGKVWACAQAAHQSVATTQIKLRRGCTSTGSHKSRYLEKNSSLFLRIDVNLRIFRWARGSVAIALAACALGADSAPPVAIQLQVVQGANASYPTGSRATRGVSVQVNDQSRQPVSDATVSFQLPDGGPGGVFEHAKKVETVITKSDGVAAVWGMQWNKVPGAFEIKVTAAKGQAHAGLAVPQFLTEPKEAGGEGVFAASHHFPTKWAVMGALAAGAGAGAFLLLHGGGSTPLTSAPVVPLQIGSPTIIIGHP